MTEETAHEITAEEIDALAHASVRKVHRTMASLLVESIDQVRTSPDTWQHDEVTVEMEDLVEEALAIDGISPQAAVFAASRASAALIVTLCSRVGLDPATLAKSFRDNLAE